MTHTYNNIQSINAQIHAKQCYTTQPGASHMYAQPVTTEYTHFPYTQWWQGQYTSDTPVVAEREAGFRIRTPISKDLHSCKYADNYPRHHFQSACNTTYPRIHNYTIPQPGGP